jgi:hypothetical protein
MTVWKIVLTPGLATYQLPDGAKFLHVAEQRGEPCAWFLCHPEWPKTPRKVLVIGTGHAFPDEIKELVHLGTALLLGGALVVHAFEVTT